jgi:hypothetical protein
VLFSLVYFLVRRLLGAGGGRPGERDIELLVLRHQLKVLQRQVARPRLNRRDRVLLAAVSRAIAEERLVRVPRAAGDPAALAPGTRPEEMVLSEDWSARTAVGRRRRPGPRRPPRPGEPPLGVPAVPRGAPQARDQDLRDVGPDDPAASWPGPCSPPGRPNMDLSSCGPRRRGSSRPTSSLSRRSGSRRSTSCSSSSSRPAARTPPASPPTPTRRGSPGRRGSPSASGCRVFGSSCATGTPRSRDRSMQCSAPRAFGSSEPRSGAPGRMPSRSAL